MPANSFIASAEAVTRNRHNVVFADINKTNYTIDLTDIEKRIGAKTKAIIAVHLYGQPCEMDDLMTLSKKYGLKIIEDCAQAHGAEYKEKSWGPWGYRNIQLLSGEEPRSIW